MRRNDPAVPPIIQRWQDNNYTWGQPRSWACFRPDADVLVPMYYKFEAQAGLWNPRGLKCNSFCTGDALSL